MLRLARRLAVISLVCLLQASSAHASDDWATWVANSPTTATGTILDGRSVLFVGSVDHVKTANDTGLTDPPIPGEPSGGNPPGLGSLTAVGHPVVIQPDQILMTLDFANYPIDAETTLGISDQNLIWRYRFEFLNSSMTPLPMANIQSTNYNVFFHPPSILIADFDVLFTPATGALRVNNAHDDPNGNYDQSGIMLLTNLPVGTRYVRMLSDSPAEQVSEGVGFYVGNTPEPASAMLGFSALATLAVLRAKRERRNSRPPEAPLG